MSDEPSNTPLPPVPQFYHNPDQPNTYLTDQTQFNQAQFDQNRYYLQPPSTTVQYPPFQTYQPYQQYQPYQPYGNQYPYFPDQTQQIVQSAFMPSFIPYNPIFPTTGVDNLGSSATAVAPLVGNFLPIPQNDQNMTNNMGADYSVIVQNVEGGSVLPLGDGGIINDVNLCENNSNIQNVPQNIQDNTQKLNKNAIPFDVNDQDMADVLDRVIATNPHHKGGEKHACSYCGLSHIESCGQCVQCQKWFCNETGALTASHLLTHLISSHHRGFKNHPASSNFDTDLECYFCNTRNVFLLGTVQTKEDNMVAIICRSPCLLSPKVKEQNFDTASWQSIIVQKKFVPWLLHPIPEELTKNAIPITAGIITKMEELWRTEPDAVIDDLYQKVLTFGKIQQTPEQFEHSVEYARIFHELVNIEAETDRLVKSQQCQEGLSLQWSTTLLDSGVEEMVPLDTYISSQNDGYLEALESLNTTQVDSFENKKNNRKKNGKKFDKQPTKQQKLLQNKRLLASFTIFLEEETSLRIVAGDELILTYGDVNDIGKGSWVGTGWAIKASLSGDITMAIDENCITDAPIDQLHGYKIQCAWKAVTYNRMHAALTRFEEMSDAVDSAPLELENQRRRDIAASGGTDNTITLPSSVENDINPRKRGFNPKERVLDKDSFDDGKKADRNGHGEKKGDKKGGKKKSSHCMSLNLYHQLLGQVHTDEGIDLPIPTELAQLEHLPPLNQYQKEAIFIALRQTLTLLQGPPGTGKTTTCAYLIYYLHQALVQKRAAALQQNPSPQSKQINPILVCAPSNIAVDHLTEKLHLAGLKVVRIASRSRQAIQSTVDFLSLHVLVGQLAIRTQTGRFYDLHQMMTHQPLSMTPSMRLEYKKLVRTASIIILNNADVICTTCIALGDEHIFGSLNIDHVLVDEATQCPEPEILIPLTQGAKQVILVGDHCQLGPVVLSRHAAKAGYNRSLFERLLLRGHVPKMLQIQYRMHPEIAKFPANTFYDGNLANGLKEKDRQFGSYVFPWPNPDVPLCFIASTGSIEEYSASGSSFINRNEVKIIENCLLYLLTRGLTLGQIGIITPYEGQRLHLMSILCRQSSPILSYLLNESVKKKDNSTQSGEFISGKHFEALTALNNLEVASVDSFQGREKDIILFTCVRSNEQSEMGFLSDPRRLNVALTRAKYGMIMTGNPKVLLKHPLWHALLCHFKLHNVFMEGGMDLDNLKPCSILIQQNQKFLNARNIRIPIGFDQKTSFGMKNIINYNRTNHRMFNLDKDLSGNNVQDDNHQWDSQLYYDIGPQQEVANNFGNQSGDLDDDNQINTEDTMNLPTSLGR
jgi:hypothetical protein